MAWLVDKVVCAFGRSSSYMIVDGLQKLAQGQMTWPWPRLYCDPEWTPLSKVRSCCKGIGIYAFTGNWGTLVGSYAPSVMLRTRRYGER